MTVTCQCGRPVSDAYLCGACTQQLRATLDGIPALVDELDTTITRQAAIGERGGPRAADKPLPFHAAASEAAWVLRNTLGGWVRVLDQGDLPADTLPAMSAWLGSRLEQLRHHEAAGEAMDEIRGAVEQATRAIDHPRIRYTFHVGPCPEDDCDGQIRAYLPADRDKAPYMTCDGETRHTYAAHQWARAGKRISESMSV